MHLQTLGHPALYRPDGSPVRGLRRKDLALLVYLAVEGTAVHARSRLAALLWGDSPEERARHSLTQALGRLARVLPPGALSADKDAVRWAAVVACDAVPLLRGGLGPADVDDAFSLYAGPFLEGFDAGAGAGDFHGWADRRSAEVRDAALRLLERAGQEAGAAGDWDRALRLAERAVQIDPVWEQGHRRLMRALSARGERNRALRHYHAFAAWLAEEVGGRPDPGTQALAEQIQRSGLPAPDAPPAPAPPEPVRPPDPGGEGDDAAPAASRPAAGTDAFSGAEPVNPISLGKDEERHRAPMRQRLSLVAALVATALLAWCLLQGAHGLLGR